MDSTLSGHKEITYLFTLTHIGDDVALKIKDEVRENAGETLRSKKETMDLLDHGVIMNYCYRNAAGKVLFEFAISK